MATNYHFEFSKSLLTVGDGTMKTDADGDMSISSICTVITNFGALISAFVPEFTNQLLKPPLAF